MSAALLEQVINGLMMGSIYVLVALGMVLIYGVMHVVNFAHGVLFTLGGYFGHFFYTRVVESYVLAIALSIVTLAIIGVLLERGVFRPLAGNLRNQVIASLGLILLLENLVVALWGASALQWKVASADRLVQIGELRFSEHHLGIIVITLALVTALGLFLKFTRFGTAIRATSQSQEAAIVVDHLRRRMHARRRGGRAGGTLVSGVSANGRCAAHQGARGHSAGRHGQCAGRGDRRHDPGSGGVGLHAVSAHRLP
jgi:branched-chain amino acid transport system permease protein